MASAKLDLVRSIVTAWERGDFDAAEWAHPDIEYVIAGGPAPGSWTGPAGMAAGTREWLNAWAELRFEVEAYRELDEERVLVFAHFSGRGRRSGVELGQMHTGGAGLFHVRGGKVTRLVHYLDRDRALADLGLPPEV